MEKLSVPMKYILPPPKKRCKEKYRKCIPDSEKTFHMPIV